MALGLLPLLFKKKKKKTYKYDTNPAPVVNTGGITKFHVGGEVGGDASDVIAKNLGNTEFHAILQRGERVLTQKDNSRADRVIGALADQVDQMSNPSRGGGGRSIRNTNQTVVNNIYANDADSFRRSEGQILGDAGVKMQRMASRNH